MSTIKKPPKRPFLLQSQQLYVQIIDYYRCLDTFNDSNDNASDASDNNNDSDDNNDCEDEDTYTQDFIRKYSKRMPELIKIFGVLQSGHTIVINAQDYAPTFYIKIPENWNGSNCDTLIESVKEDKRMFYRDVEGGIKLKKIVKRKPLKEFTAEDKFKYLRLDFKNKQIYDCYARILKDKYELYETNIDPLIKFIHEQEIKAGGIVEIKAGSYTYVQSASRTTIGDYEINTNYKNIIKSDKIEQFPINIAAVDIEADSSHGDFPVAKKTYLKLTQDLLTLYCEKGSKGLLKQDPIRVLCNLLKRCFNPFYNNDLIHQCIIDYDRPLEDLANDIYTAFINLNTVSIDFLKMAKSEEIEFQHILKDKIFHILQHSSLAEKKSNNNNEQSNNKEEPKIIRTCHDIAIQIMNLHRLKNESFIKNPVKCIEQMIDLSQDPFIDYYSVSRIYTKGSVIPKEAILKPLVEKVLPHLKDCLLFRKNKKYVPRSFTMTKEKTKEQTTEQKDASLDKVSIDYFTTLINNILCEALPAVEGDPCVQIGTSFKIFGHTDPYLKHIVCLKETSNITNEEMIEAENGSVYLPNDELVKDLLYYEANLTGQLDKISEILKNEDLINRKLDEIKSWNKETRKKESEKSMFVRRLKQKETDHSIVIVEWFNTEAEVLTCWSRLMLENNPDVIIGYNVFGFDYRFLYERADETGCLREFSQISRLKDHKSSLIEYKLSSSALGDNKLDYIDFSGRLNIDLIMVIRKTYQLGAYNLDSVCNKFLSKEKVDLSPQDLFIMQKGTPDDRKQIAIYCLVDGILCLRLLDKLDVLINAINMANICEVPISYCFLRGQGVKLASLVRHECDKKGYVMPVLPKSEDTEGYEGAIVLVPKTGIYYDSCVVTLDFNSLYPSSMISENLSHCTYCPVGSKYYNLPQYTYSDIKFNIYNNEPVYNKKGKKTKKMQKVKVGEKVVRFKQPRNEDDYGIVPGILIRLLKARKDTKAKMASEKDPFKYKNLDGEQLSQKTVANSLYGQMAAKTGLFYNVDIAASTTAIGRSMITFSKNYIEKTYKKATKTFTEEETLDDNKPKRPTKYAGMTVHIRDTTCVYGDTDSVFIRFNLFTESGERIIGLDNVFISMALGKIIAKEISSQLKRPQNLDFEKCILPFLLISKKRYTGLYYTKMGIDKCYLNSMGIVMKRRDNADIVKHVFGGALKIIMNDHDIDKALQFVLDECKKMLYGEFPLDKFIISKTLKSYYKFPDRIAHNVLAKRQEQRDPGNKFQPNSRVPYVFIKNADPKALQGDCIETPDFITKNGLEIDYEKYFQNQIRVPVAQIFALDPKYANIDKIFDRMVESVKNEKKGGLDFSRLLTKSSIVYEKPVIRSKTVTNNFNKLSDYDKPLNTSMDTDNDSDENSDAEDADEDDKKIDDDQEEYVNNLDNPLDPAYSSTS